MVPRRLEEREAGADRLRAPLRAHDVPGLEERPRRVLLGGRGARRQPPGGGRQRHHRQRPHQLLRDRAVGQPREAPLARERPPGDAARRHRPGEARQPARRGQERTPAELREPALRALARAPGERALPLRPSLLLVGHRQHGRSLRRLARRRAGVLPHLLHAQQPVAGHRRRLRSGGRQAAGREVLRLDSAGAGARAAEGRPGRARRRQDPRDRRPRAAGAGLHDLADAAALRRGRRRARSRGARSRRRPVVPAHQGAGLRRPEGDHRQRLSIRHRDRQLLRGDRQRPPGRRRRGARIVGGEGDRAARGLGSRRRPSSSAPRTSSRRSTSPASSASAASVARPTC